MKVIFPHKKVHGTNRTEYPDDIKNFSNTQRVGANVIADYSGDLELTPHIDEPVKIEKPMTIDEKLDALMGKIDAVMVKLDGK